MKPNFIVCLALGLAVPAFSNTIDLSTGTATWTVVENNAYNNGATGTAQVVTPSDADYFSGWVPNDANSSWVAYDPNNCCDSGYGTYSTTFDLTGYDLSTVSLNGSWTVDDAGSIFLNGNLLGTLDDGYWTALYPIGSIPTSDFNQGSNTLTIQITDSDNILEGVRMEGSVSGDMSTVPEPSSFLLLMIVLATVIGFVERRRRSVAHA